MPYKNYASLYTTMAVAQLCRLYQAQLVQYM